jgi:hypothetical protein
MNASGPESLRASGVSLAGVRNKKTVRICRIVNRDQVALGRRVHQL